jgi:hypothetical protein
MSAIVKKNIPLIVTFLIGIILVFEWFIPTDIGNQVGTGIRESGIIINSFAVMAGVIGLYLNETRKIMRKRDDWPYSVWMIIVVSLYIAIGVPLGYQSDTYQWIYNSILMPLGATMYGAISFYIAAAAYRVLKFRSLQAVVLLLPAMILILGNTPMLTSFWTGFVDIGSWIMSYITQPVYTGIMVGVALGTMATGVRTLLGLETGWLGRKEEGE